MKKPTSPQSTGTAEVQKVGKTQKLRAHAAKLKAISWRSPYVIATSVLIVLGGSLATYAFWYADRYLPHTSVAGVQVAGLTRSEAEVQVLAKVKAFSETPLKLSYEDKSWELTPTQLGTTFAVGEALDTLWQRQKGGTWQDQMQQLAKAPLTSQREDVGFTTFSDEGEALFADSVRKDIEVSYNETSLAITSKKVTVVPGKQGKRVDASQFDQRLYQAFTASEQNIGLALVPFDPELTAEQAEPARQQVETLLAETWYVRFGDVGNGVIEPDRLAKWLATEVARDASGKAEGLRVVVSADQISEAVTDWAANFDRKPTNGRVGVTDGKVVLVEAGKNGLVIDTKATESELQKQLLAVPTPVKRDVIGVVITAQPPVRQDTLASLGLTSLIGTGTTDFTGSPANRRTNITLGQKNLNGKLVMPGEVYSTVDELGPVEESSGFAVGLVIKNNRTIPEAGGGLCQVSTTLFRAVMNAGLPVTERANHSYRVSYYERGVGPGLDATIYGPHPDFRWKNDLANAVLVQSYIKGNSITFELYGTGDGRTSTISPPTILETIPVGPPIYNQTDTLFVGEQVQIETPHTGAKTVVTYSVMRDGKEINRQVFRSTYKAWPAQYMVGTKERPAGS